MQCLLIGESLRSITYGARLVIVTVRVVPRYPLDVGQLGATVSIP